MPAWKTHNVWSLASLSVLWLCSFFLFFFFDLRCKNKTLKATEMYRSKQKQVTSTVENILKLDSSTFTSTDRQELHSAVNKGQDLDSLYSKMRQFYQDQQLSFVFIYTIFRHTHHPNNGLTYRGQPSHVCTGHMFVGESSPAGNTHMCSSPVCSEWPVETETETMPCQSQLEYKGEITKQRLGKSSYQQAVINTSKKHVGEIITQSIAAHPILNTKV